MTNEHEKVRQIFIGHLTLDDVVLPDGSTKFDSPGGAALYAAAGAFLWDTRVGLVARRGRDYSMEIIRQLENYGLDLTGTVMVDKPNIHIWALYDKYGHRYFIPQYEAGSYEELAPEPEGIPSCYLEDAQGFHLAPLPLPYQIKLLEALPENKIITLDPHHEWVSPEHMELWEKVLPKVNVFMPSEDEFVSLWAIDKQEDIMSYIPYLKRTASMGSEIVALKVGKKGALVYSTKEDNCWHIPTIARKVVDVTGAGDAFCGGFLTGFLNTGDPLHAAMNGIVSSSVIIEHFGVTANLNYDRNIIKSRFEELQALLAGKK